MKKILIADDHGIVRTGLILLIREELGLVEIDECRDGDSARRKIQANEYDLVILDISMPFTDTFVLLENVFAEKPGQKVLILTMSREEVYAKRFLKLGVKGFINKEADRSEIRNAIVCTLNNKRYLSSRMHDTLSGEMLDEITPNPFETLSPRELEIMNQLLEGKHISEIASVLFLHISTVSTHKTNLMQKLGVSNVIELSKMVQMF
jgi:DNA-binding NarL/FixJ family response regulator